MCDYSLEAYSSRPARELERYVTTRFPSGCIGLVCPGDPRTAVCLPYGARLLLDGAPKTMQASLSVDSVAEASFVRLRNGGPYKDGLRLQDGRSFALQDLGLGVGATVLRLVDRPAAEGQRIEEAELPQF